MSRVEDITIKRADPFIFTDSIHWNYDGSIAIIGSKEVEVLAPKLLEQKDIKDNFESEEVIREDKEKIVDAKSNGKPSSNFIEDQSLESSQFFQNLIRLSTEYQKVPNKFAGCVVFEESLRVGEAEQDHTVKSVCWAPMNVNRGKPLIALTTDTLQTLILENDNNDYTLKFNMLDYLLDVEDIDLEMVISDKTVRSIRCQGFYFLDTIQSPKNKNLDNLQFLMFTESSTQYLYELTLDNKINRIQSFNLKLPDSDDEFIKLTKVSKWFRTSNPDIWKLFFVIIYTDNSLLINSIEYCLSTNKFTISENNSFLIPPSKRSLLVNLDFLEYQNDSLILTAIGTNKIYSFKLNVKILDTRDFDNEKIIDSEYKNELGTYISCNSITQLGSPTDHQIIITNTSGELIFFNLDWSNTDDKLIHKRKYDYTSKKIKQYEPMNKSPVLSCLINKLIQLNGENQLMIINIKVSPSSDTLLMTYNNADSEFNIDSRIPSNKEYYLALVPVVNDTDPNFQIKNLFSTFIKNEIENYSLNSSFLKSIEMNLLNLYTNEDEFFKIFEESLLNHAETLGLIGDLQTSHASDLSLKLKATLKDSLQRNYTYSSYVSILKLYQAFKTQFLNVNKQLNEPKKDEDEMDIDKPFQKSQFFNIYHYGDPVILENSKLPLLLHISNIVYRWIETNKVEITDNKDQLIYESMVQLLVSVGLVDLKVLDLDSVIQIDNADLEIVEAFSFSLPGDESFNPNSITSLERHKWKRCALTLLPLMDPEMKICSYCHSRITGIDTAGTIILSALMDAFKTCPYCSSSFVTR
ncbi:hypothetical protein B5S28_g4412 [[Candida] boidinii]|uniref:Unnamed protein product n=1 Tax=Candida boidinii TaxID=5477 RepID=A0ACB5TG86_CANBO|nr:hypothetical protein B5S28_g4412 [[Candida] boidinii]OWB62749.1 hypothetical protein B5S29_g3692 [[Candida] boidinii]OWB72710.1 hypothetical protein B5S31_g2430 [[Candida] boidinii]GME87768.1 unnamed protein product [[Candida] boidinii]